MAELTVSSVILLARHGTKGNELGNYQQIYMQLAIFGGGTSLRNPLLKLGAHNNAMHQSGKNAVDSLCFRKQT